VPIAGIEQALPEPAQDEQQSAKWFPTWIVVGIVLLMLVGLTFPGQMAIWFVLSSMGHMFEQDYGDPNAPINKAARSQNWKEFEALVQDRGQRKKAGFPRLTAKLAAEDGQNSLLVMLIEKYGLNVNQRIYDRDPRTAIDFAVANTRADTVDLLIKRGATIHTATELGDDHILWSLTTVKSGDEQRRKDAVRIAQLLIARGEPLRAGRADGPDPLNSAIKEKFPEMVKILLDAGASPEVETGRLGSPLALAESVDCGECKRLLFEAGVKPTSAN
jgi:hypothetical protein